MRFIAEKDLCRFFRSTDIVEVEAKEVLSLSILSKVILTSFLFSSSGSVILGVSTLFLVKDISTCPEECWMILEIAGFEELGWIAFTKVQVSRKLICSQGVTKGMVTLAFEVSMTKNVVCPLVLNGFWILEFKSYTTYTESYRL